MIMKVRTMKLELMQRAIELAKMSGNDIPVGALILKDGKVIAEACNEREKNNDTSAHAEIVAIRKAGKKLNNWRLNNCEMYVTLEPCPMCAAAIIQSRISRLYFGAYDIVNGAFGSKFDIRHFFDSSLLVEGGFMEDENTKLLKDYFKDLR